jgi:SAM-dependent methyltransferase
MNRTNKRDDLSLRNTYLFDAENMVEFTRLINQDRFITRAMGGVQAGLPDLPSHPKILDLACGAGGWALDMAYELPYAEVCGVDSSPMIIEYANARASSQGITNSSFGRMDITKPLDFSDASFDLIHARFLMGVLKRNAWFPVVTECRRLLRPGGLLQLVEGNDAGRSLSPALEQLNHLGTQALWHTGYGFSPDGHTFGMAPGLLRLLKQASYRDLCLCTTTIDHSADSEGWADFYHNQELLLQGIKPLVLNCALTNEQEFDALYQKALIEMYADDFTAIGQILSIRGRKQTENEEER